MRDFLFFFSFLSILSSLFFFKKMDRSFAPNRDKTEKNLPGFSKIKPETKEEEERVSGERNESNVCCEGCHPIYRILDGPDQSI
jgi:hypothetical protein